MLIGREDVVKPDPDPEPIQKALNQLQNVTSGIWMVGDTCIDMHAATAANIEKMALLCGYGSHDDLKKCTDNIYQSALNAVECIAKI